MGWDQDQVPYDERSSVFVNVGTDYGTGKRQPVGSEKVTHGFDPTKGLERGPLDRKFRGSDEKEDD